MGVLREVPELLSSRRIGEKSSEREGTIFMQVYFYFARKSKISSIFSSYRIFEKIYKKIIKRGIGQRNGIKATEMCTKHCTCHFAGTFR